MASKSESTQKELLVLEQLLYRLRSDLVPDSSVTINFDLMANQPLPKAPINEAILQPSASGKA